MSSDPLATPPERDAAYPRPAAVRFFRLLLRFLWIVILLGLIGAVAPNAWVLYQKTQGFSAFLDPNNLGSLFYIPQMTQLVGGDTTLLIGLGAGAGVLFLLLFVFGLRAGGDARRERKSLRARALHASWSVSTPADTTTPTAPAPGVALAAPTPTPSPVTAPAAPIPAPVVAATYADPAPGAPSPAASVSFASSSWPGRSVYAAPEPPIPAVPSEQDSEVAHDPPPYDPPQDARDAEPAGESGALDATPEIPDLSLPDLEPMPAPAYAAPDPVIEPSVPDEPLIPSSIEPSPVYEAPVAVTAPSSETMETPTMSSTPPQSPPPQNPSGPAPSWWAPAPGAAPAPPQVAAPPSYPLAPMYPAPTYPPASNYPQPPYYPQSPYYPTAPGGVPSTPLAPGSSPAGSLQDFGRAAVASMPLLANAAQAVGKMTAPKQDETGISPAPFAARAPGWAHTEALTDRQLGDWADGWFDTVPGMAENAGKMIQAFVDDLPTHFRPSVNALSTRLGVTGVNSLATGIDLPVAPVAVVRVAKAVPAAIQALPRLILRVFGVTIVGKQRDYLFAVTTPGAIVGVMITGAGRDLYMAWDLFIRRVWNEIVIGLVALASLLFGLFFTWGAYQASRALSSLGSSYNPYGSYYDTPAPAPTGMSPVAVVFVFILSTVLAFFAMLGAGIVLGSFLKRDPMAFFRKRIDLFEAHDVQSMALSVDKALRASAQRAGVDAKLLRAKEQFVSGQGKSARFI